MFTVVIFEIFPLKKGQSYNPHSRLQETKEEAFPQKIQKIPKALKKGVNI